MGTTTKHDGYIYGLNQLKFKDAILGQISEESIDWAGDDRTVNKVWSAQKRTAPVTEIVSNNGTTELTFDMIELIPENLKMVLGGEVVGGKWSAPSEIIKLSGPAEIKTADGVTISIPNASLVAKPKGKIDYAGVFKVNCKLTVLMPADDVAPYEITYPTTEASA